MELIAVDNFSVLDFLNHNEIEKRWQEERLQEMVSKSKIQIENGDYMQLDEFNNAREQKRKKWLEEK